MSKKYVITNSHNPSIDCDYLDYILYILLIVAICLAGYKLYIYLR